MSDYTPTTYEVALAYVHGADGDRWTKFKAYYLREEFYRWLAEHDREVKAEAWDEGFDAGELSINYIEDYTPNPYREETE